MRSCLTQSRFDKLHKHPKPLFFFVMLTLKAQSISAYGNSNMSLQRFQALLRLRCAHEIEIGDDTQVQVALSLRAAAQPRHERTWVTTMLYCTAQLLDKSPAVNKSETESQTATITSTAQSGSACFCHWQWQFLVFRINRSTGVFFELLSRRTGPGGVCSRFLIALQNKIPSIIRPRKLFLLEFVHPHY